MKTLFEWISEDPEFTKKRFVTNKDYLGSLILQGLTQEGKWARIQINLDSEITKAIEEIVHLAGRI